MRPSGALLLAVVALALPRTALAIDAVGLESAPFRFVAHQQGARLGQAVAAAFGFRADDETRLVAGAYLWDGPAADAGLVATFGSRSEVGEQTVTSAEWLLLATELGDRLGSAVAGGGDVNDDGVADLAAGAWSVDVGEMFDAGAVYVRFGAALLPAVDQTPEGADLVLLGEAGTDHFGYSVAIDGDVNGDGVEDIVIGSPLGQGKDVSTGEVFVFFGGAHLTSGMTLTTDLADVHIAGSLADGGLGHTVATGNVNGDAFDDVLIGAPSATLRSRFHCGGAYLFLGRAFASGAEFTAEDDYDVEISGATPEDAFGTAAVMFDVDGDSLDEILAGAPFAEVGSDASAGRVYLFGGAPISVGASIRLDAAVDSDRTLNGDDGGDLFGWSIAEAGDLNLDLLSELLIGAPGADPGGRAGAGSAFLAFSEAGVLLPSGRASTVMDIVYEGTSAGDETGASVAGIGDFNRDGGNDLAIGAPGATNGGYPAGGAVHVFTGLAPISVSDLTGGARYLLEPPAPNPTAGGVRLRILAPGEGVQRASIVDALGRVVRVLANEPRGARSSVISWDGRDASGAPVGSGVYFLSLEGAAGRESARIVVAR